MKKITINDIIFATATIRGCVAASLRLSGFATMADIIRAVRAEIGSTDGIMTISLRNMTQGWSDQKSLYLSTAPVHTAAGRQLTLF